MLMWRPGWKPVNTVDQDNAFYYHFWTFPAPQFDVRLTQMATSHKVRVSIGETTKKKSMEANLPLVIQWQLAEGLQS